MNKKTSANAERGSFERFEDLARKLVNVPKREIERKAKAHTRKRKKTV